jgi:nitroreductase
MPDALELLRTRRSPKIPDLIEPGPSAIELDQILTIAAHVPDHGKLVPWRFLVIEGEGRKRAAEIVLSVFRADHPNASAPEIAKETKRLNEAPLCVAVVSRAAPHPKIPEWEQQLSAGAACMSLVFAANALGFGTNWVTGWPAYDRRVLDAFGLKAHERIAGFVHIGTPRTKPEDRPRPPLSDIVTRL